jgi:hypothetical protein
MAHNPNIWMQDRRPIVAARPTEYGSDILAADGVTFERFERNGEMASIPYLRATGPIGTIEAPLRNWAWVAFGDDPPASAEEDQEIPF